MHVQNDVCVIGNGAIGKAAALGLARVGLGVTLLYPSTPGNPVARDGWVPRVYALNHTAHGLLDSLKVWDAMDAARIAAVDAMAINGDARERAGKLSFDAYGARADALAWIVEDRNLNAGLDNALQFAPDLRIVAGRAAQLRIAGDAATIVLDGGDTIGASLLVGADGAQSWLRAQADIGIDYRPYGQQAVVANFECEQPHHDTAHEWFTAEEGIVALLPLPGRRVSLVWSAPEALANTLMRESAAQLAQRLAALAGEALGALRPLQPDAVKAFPLTLMRAHAMVAPRVALVGDAAHVIHPLAGQGMNLGFGDVVALLKAVGEREPHRTCGDARVLARYARARKEEVWLMQLATDGLQRLFAADFEPLRLLRNAGLHIVDRLPSLKRRFVSHALGSSSVPHD